LTAFIDITFRMRTAAPAADAACTATIVRPLAGARNPQDVTADVSCRRTLDLRQSADAVAPAVARQNPCRGLVTASARQPQRR
jgi:hypothetical protein